MMIPKVVATLQPWAEIGERLRRYKRTLSALMANAFALSTDVH